MAEVDLHCHTLASDGSLTPKDVVQRAYENGVRHLAITDHDTCNGLPEAQAEADILGMNLISGIELSSQWRGMGIHVVGLNFDLDSQVMKQAIGHQYHARVERAEQIGIKLDKLKFPIVYEEAKTIAGRPDVGRPHFAQAMVKLGYVKNEIEAFDKYLGAGKPGDIKMHWPSVEQVVTWITDSGGTAVLAHPGKYNMTWSKLRGLIDHFVDVGGQAMEVSYSGENPDRLAELNKLASQYGLMVSVGSDFHNPKHHWTELGKYPPIRGEYTGVWQNWV